MVFPRSGLPNEVSAQVRTAIGTDGEDNVRYTTKTAFKRPARFYRDSGRELVGSRDGVIVTGMVAFPADATDTLELVPEDSEILIHNGQFKPTGDRHQVVHATLQMLWHRPSHWEVVVGRTS